MLGFSVHDSAVMATTFGCGEPLLGVIADAARHAAFSRGRCAHPNGDAEQTTLMLDGHAHEVAYGRDGGVVVLHVLSTGEMFGSMLDSAGSNDPIEVTAVTDLRGAQFSGASLLRLMENHSCVAMAVARQLSKRLHTMRQRMTDTVLLSATGRICAELMRRAQASCDGVVRPVPVFVDFALIAQTTRETVSRTMSQLEKRGIVEREDDGLRIVAPHRLEELIH